MYKRTAVRPHRHGRILGKYPVRMVKTRILKAFILTMLINLDILWLPNSRSGGTGRRARLKLVFPLGLWVRFPPSAYNKAYNISQL